MSPRRRVVLIVAACLAIALAAVAGIATLRSRSGSPEADAAQDRPGPVLLIPGYGGSTTALEGLRGHLLAAGRQAVIVPAIGDGTGDLTAQARRVRAAAKALIAGGAPSVDVVGYSAGGVVARIWIGQQGGAPLVRRVVTLGSPHHGTSVAQLGALVVPGSCPTACRQLIPDSDLLTSLPETPAGPVWTSLWTTADDVVTPPDSARLAGAVDIPLQQVCADDRSGHGQLPTDPLVVGIVLRALGTTPLTAAPPASDCTALRAAGANS
jgi:triacylglycerol lipase